MNSRPNLFTYATNELSQDAFLCWLLSWADPQMKNVDESLYKSGQDFIRSLLNKAGIDPPGEIQKLEVKKQFQAIDVFVLINDEIALVIEDKVHSQNHSDQLKRYRKLIKEEFPKHQIAYIYLKTGDQSNYREVEEKGFATFTRMDLLAVLQRGKDVDNHIYRDFLSHLENMHESVEKFRSVSLDQWDWFCWTGFFIELQNNLGDGEWAYIPNPSGGFMGYWWHSRGNKYLLLEGNFDSKTPSRLCFKITVQDQKEQSKQRNEWHEVLSKAASDQGYSLSKPARFGKGTHMTAAVADGDFRKTDADRLLDLEATLNHLREAENFLESLIESSGR